MVHGIPLTSEEKMRRLFLFVAALCLLAWIVPATAQWKEDFGIFDTLKLKNFNPQSRLEVPAHVVLRAKCPVIDAHSHTYLRGDVAEADEPAGHFLIYEPAVGVYLED